MRSSEDNIIDVLYVDDEPTNLVRFKYSLRKNYKMIFAGSAKEGLEILENTNIKVVVADLRMPEMDGNQFLEIVTQ